LHIPCILILENVDTSSATTFSNTKLRLAAISYFHRLSGSENPCVHPTFLNLKSAARRRLSAITRDRHPPLPCRRVPYEHFSSTFDQLDRLHTDTPASRRSTTHSALAVWFSLASSSTLTSGAAVVRRYSPRPSHPDASPLSYALAACSSRLFTDARR
jgi:hypothetical protein